MNFKTIPEMFYKTCDKYGNNNKPALMFKKAGEWKKVTHKELREKVECLAIGFLELGLHAKDRIGLVSENRLEWIVSDFATASIGAIDVPVFPTLTSKQMEYIFSDCSATAIIVSNKLQLNKILEIKDNIPSLRHIFVMNEDIVCDDLSVRLLSTVEQRGKELKNPEKRKAIINQALSKIEENDLLTLIYTSGTTGNPKGVMLSQKNIVTNIFGCHGVLNMSETDTFLSYLPFCHAYERTTGYYTAFSAGSTIAIAESIETVASNIQEIQPTIMTTVPRLLEIIMKKIQLGVSKESQIKQKVFDWAFQVGKDWVDAKFDKHSIPIWLKTKHQLADKLVYSKLREKLGGKVCKFFSGGAPLSPDVGKFFIAAGIAIFQGYGLTEASPVVTVNYEDNFEAGTIGEPLYNLEVKIAEDGEILVRGDSVMVGYWNDEQATRAAIDEEGWLYTGDVGQYTQRKNIVITDRKKNIFVSSGGKNIAPQPIENLITLSPYIEQCILVGDNREYCTALITPDFEQLRILADNFQIKYRNINELISNQQIINVIKNDIDRNQKDLAKYERVRKFTLLTQPFSIENGELTPKMSVRRHVVERKYSSLIDEMYGLD